MKLGFGFTFSFNEDRQHFKDEQMGNKISPASGPQTLIQKVAAHNEELKANIYLNTIGKFFCILCSGFDKGKVLKF